jgi:hypothetical protein
VRFFTCSCTHSKGWYATLQPTNEAAAGAVNLAGKMINCTMKKKAQQIQPAELRSLGQSSPASMNPFLPKPKRYHELVRRRKL